ncbi:class I fructose-bisphosphate aldolase [Kaistella jeonii]|uniref:Fructose-bisphosphate aldolase n=1 Tax=Kaistella jeonii TaxID=266749 RepID=A0A0C1EYV2_9FLAO|nr:class I fructose-bisphosphate aldolase [Kaistella jeonii]KIA86017.1 fructose-bisphosphate aldolase [Kaistella jeonii]SFC36802.1 fructose-bisphosphate aldolase, class I [Kaistella jeonii]VEI97283.1 Fructose-bisphosphate aldolase class 1 [Kaistella jeonii]
MNTQILKDTIQQIFANGKGILAMDESTPTCIKRFEAAGIPQTTEMYRKYRELIVTTPGLNESIGGAILFDETIRQKTDDGEPMAKVLIKAGIISGIKVDMGAKSLAGFPNEKVTEGLDGLRERLTEYKTMGACFAKWRAVITIGDGIPTNACIEANVHALARYAALCQEADIVPIVEPEVLMDGNHTLQQCYEVTERVLKALFYELYQFKIDLEGIILKPNMVIAGKDCPIQNSIDEVAEATVNCLRASVPASVPAIAFLSGGQSPKVAAEHLNAINKNFKDRLPWIVAFSFARAIQQPALDAWKGEQSNMEEAQKLLCKYAKMASTARLGKYNSMTEE